MKVKTIQFLKEINVELAELSKFKDGSIRTIVVDKIKGITVIVGALKGDTKATTQSFVFDREKEWTQETALKWAEENGSCVKEFNLSDVLESKALDWFHETGEEMTAYKIVREYTHFTYEEKGRHDDDDDDDDKGPKPMRIRGYLSTFKNTDRQNDVVKATAFDETIKGLKKLPMQRDHSGSTQDQMGAWVKFTVDKVGLLVDGGVSITKNTAHERQLIEDKFLDTLSMGGLFKYAEKQDKKGRNVIEKVILFEGSIVSMPANLKATFEAKSLVVMGEKEELVGEEPNDTLVPDPDKATRLKELFRRKKNGSRN